MRIRQALIVIATSWITWSCGNPSVEKTTDGLVVEIKQEAPANMVRLTVFDEKILGVASTGSDEFAASPAFLRNTSATGTPFDTKITDTQAGVYTSTAGITVNRYTSEVVFTDSVGNELLTVIPGEIVPGDIERSINNELGGYKIVYSHPATEAIDSTAGIITDSYNILWKSSDDGSQEQLFLVFGEQVDRFNNVRRINN